MSKNSENENKGIGRPSALTEKVLIKLEQAFSIGCSNREASAYANIAESTLQLHIKNNSDFSEQVNAWKEKPILKSRQVVVNAINNGNVNLAWDYLQKKKRDEFGTRTELTGANGAPIQTTQLTQDEARKQADEMDSELDGD